MDDLIAARLSRRALLQGVAADRRPRRTPATALAQARSGASTLTFAEVPQGLDDTHHVAAGYKAQILIRWGDPVMQGRAGLRPAQPDRRRAGRSSSATTTTSSAYMPLPLGSQQLRARAALRQPRIHEHRADVPRPRPRSRATARSTDASRSEIEMAAHGLSVVEVEEDRRQLGRSSQDSRYNRRITDSTRRCSIAGPAAGHARLKTTADRTGTRVHRHAQQLRRRHHALGHRADRRGELQRLLPAATPTKTPEAAQLQALRLRRLAGCARGASTSTASTSSKEPNEPNRFGWIVEIDPYDPNSTPVKRTALGRFKHEGATRSSASDGRVVVLLRRRRALRIRLPLRHRRAPSIPSDRAANRDLLDEGTLSVARFNADGTLDWLPLVHRPGPADRRQRLQQPGRRADRGPPRRRPARRHADGPARGRRGQPGDRPRLHRPAPTTADARRPDAAIDAGQSARRTTRFGHIVEMIPPGDGTEADHAATRSRWEIFLLAGNPAEAEQRRHVWRRASAPTAGSPRPTTSPSIRKGRIWIATDGMPTQPKPGIADGLCGSDTSGPGRAVPRRFFADAARRRDVRALLHAGQQDAVRGRPASGAKKTSSTFDKPTTRWPDFKPDMPPRPSVVVDHQGRRRRDRRLTTQTKSCHPRT